MAVRSSDPAWLKEAYKDLGLKEIHGSRDNQRIVDMFAESGHAWVKDDETAWCAAAVGAWLKRAGKVGTGSLAARSYQKWGKKVKNPKRGDVVVFKRGNSSWQGHVAFYLKEKAGRVEHIGGNQRNAVTISSTPKSKLLGYRRPSTLKNSKVVKVATASAGISTFGLADLSGYAPDALSLAGSLEPVHLAIGLAVVAVGASAFFIWDRYQKTKLGV